MFELGMFAHPWSGALDTVVRGFIDCRVTNHYMTYAIPVLAIQLSQNSQSGYNRPMEDLG